MNIKNIILNQVEENAEKLAQALANVRDNFLDNRDFAASVIWTIVSGYKRFGSLRISEKQANVIAKFIETVPVESLLNNLSREDAEVLGLISPKNDEPTEETKEVKEVKEVKEAEETVMVDTETINYVDLGLKSKTLWADKNSVKVDEGVNLPTCEQFQELIEECEWGRKGSSYRVTGPNGRSILLEATEESTGNYWSSTPTQIKNERFALSFYREKHGVERIGLYGANRECDFAVRSVK